MTRLDSSSIIFGSLISDGRSSIILGGLTMSSFASNSNCDATICFSLRLLMPIANSNPTVNSISSKITANCNTGDCSCNVCITPVSYTHLTLPTILRV